MDGFGDFSSAAWGLGNNESLSIDGRVLFPHSLGVFYQALTQFLGFPKYGDEYKVMGLAPYGKPIYLNLLREILKLEEDGLNMNTSKTNILTTESNYIKEGTSAVI